MRILIQPPGDLADAHRVSEQVRRAMEILGGIFIRTDGGGTIETDGVVTGVIMLRSEDEASQALAALAKSGIKASIG